MNYVFLGAFAAFSAVHLYASWKCDKILRAVTKVFLLPTLLGWYLTTVQTPLDIVIAAVATSWLGDVLLIFGTVGFAVGGFSFFISHLCFAAAYCMHVDFSLVPVWLMILAAAVYIAAVALVFRGLIGNVRPKSLYVGMISYLIINGTMNCFALFQLVTLPVEINASRRALAAIGQTHMLDEDEYGMAKKTLTAAAMTYVAALAVSLAQLLRLLLIFGGRNRDDR